MPARRGPRPHTGRHLAAAAPVAPGPGRSVDSALARLKGLFLEMPETPLTVEQARVLTKLDGVTCLALLIALEQSGFLRRSGAGQFLLRTDSTGMDRDRK
jgi:hypothetical protein